MKASAIGAVLRLAGDAPDVIALAAGSPAPETFCAEAVAEVTDRLLRKSADPLQYGDTEGLPALREWIADDALGATCRPEQVIMTHGSQQGIDLVCKAVLDPDDVVVVDRPTYIGALQVFNLYQATVVEVPMASDGCLVQLERMFVSGVQAKLIYTVPNYANPTGLTLSREQRVRLAELAARHRCLIVEDDPYRDLYYTERADRPLPISASSDGAVRLGSFSKVLFPASRLGYIIAPPPLADVLGKLKQAADLGNSNFLQQVVHALVSEPGFMDLQLDRIRRLYRERRDALVASLRHSLGDELEFEVPEGGFFVWGRLRENVSATDLLPEAIAQNVSFVPGVAFYASRADQSTLRLSFSCAPADEMADACARLRRAWARLKERGAPAGAWPVETR